MHTIIHPHVTGSRKRSVTGGSRKQSFHRKPLYDCTDRADTLDLQVYVPGVEAAGVEVTAHGPDLVIQARKSHFVRVNFTALHLESAQRDYELVLRLGTHLDFGNLEAGIQNGVLRLRIPKKVPSGAPREAVALPRVA